MWLNLRNPKAMTQLNLILQLGTMSQPRDAELLNPLFLKIT